MLAALVLVYVASPASAHSVLLATAPVASGRVPSTPASVVLTFNEMPQGRYSNIHVFGPDGARRDSGHVRVLNDTVTEDLGGSRPAGRYVVDWRVVSADGHPVSGQFTFTATSSAAALAAPQPDATGNQTAKKSGGGSTGVIAAVGATVVILVIVAAAAVARRRRNPRATRVRGELADND